MLIEIKDLYKNYVMGELEVPALMDINVQIAKNEYVAIMGPSGSGKSTLMNILGCLDTPTSGQYLFNGVDVSQLDDDALSAMRNREIGFIFQNFNLLPKLTALQNVELPLIYAGASKQERHERAVQALQKVSLADRMSHKPTELSGGQRQRVAIARALVNEPRLVLADEPTGNLDHKSATAIYELMCQLNRELGTAFVVVTHDRELAGKLHRQVHMVDGALVGGE